MSLNLFNDIKKAITNLSPNEIRTQSERPVRIGLHAQSEQEYQQMEAFFTPSEVTQGRRSEIAGLMERATFRAGEVSPAYDIEIFSQGMKPAEHGFTFYLNNPEHTVSDILRARPELEYALARQIFPFRAPVVDALVKRVAKENALFSLATAVPDIVPFITLPWAIGEFASDTVVLTANQVRMAFLLAAASDREIGYREQQNEIVTILLGAFGWRALARELVGKIPFGGGLIPKAAVAYAGTHVVGMSIERFYRIGYGFSRAERKAAYGEALERGKTIASSLLSGVRNKTGQPKE